MYHLETGWWAFFMKWVSCYLKADVKWPWCQLCYQTAEEIPIYSSIATYLDSLTHRVEVYVVFIKYFMYKYRLHTEQSTHYKSHTEYC